jgi:hypothetical protein
VLAALTVPLRFAGSSTLGEEIGFFGRNFGMW